MEHSVEIQSRRDFPADLVQQCQVSGPLLRSMELGVAQGERGGRGQTLEQLPVTLVENSEPGGFAGNLDGPDADPIRHHRRGHHRGGKGALARIHLFPVAGIANRPGDHRSLLLLSHVPHEPGAHRHQRADQPLS